MESQNKYDYTAFYTLIESLQNENEQSKSNEKAEELLLKREHFAANFLPPSKFWLDWIIDKIAAGGEDKNVGELDELFDRALSECPSVDIVKEMVDNAFHRYEADLMSENVLRVLLDRAISICGADVMDGASLWSRLIEIQLDSLQDLIDTAAEKREIQSVKESIVSVYRRQFSLPLLGNKRSLVSFEKVLSDICVESDNLWILPEVLIEKYQTAEVQLQARIMYEQNVLSDEFASSPQENQLSAWKTYIRFEIEDKKIERAQRLYERCLISCPQSMEMWLDYIEFAETYIKEWSLVQSITARTLKIDNSVKLWMQHLLAIDLAGSCSLVQLNITETLVKQKEAHSKVVEDTLIKAVAKALGSGLQSGDDYLTILFFSCDFKRRMLLSHLQEFMSPSSQADRDGSISILLQRILTDNVSSLRESFNEIEVFLSLNYQDWAEGWLKVYKYYTSVEDDIVSEVTDAIGSDDNDDSDDHVGSLSSKSKEIWERGITRVPKQFFIWKEYIQWARAGGDYELCRILYRRSLKAVKDLPEDVCKAYLSFEQQMGTISDLCTAITSTKTIMKKAALRYNKIKASAKDAPPINLSKTKNQKTIVTAPPPPQVGQKRTIDNQSLSSNTAADVTGENLIEMGDAKRSKEEVSTKEVIADSTANRHSEAIKKPDIENKVINNDINIDTIDRTVMIKNLSFNSTVEDISGHFAICGEIQDARLVLSKLGKSRGQAIIVFSETVFAEEALKLHESLLENRPISVEFATVPAEKVKDEDQAVSNKVPSAQHPTTVFVSKFSQDVTNDILSNIFRQCGEIVEARVVIDKRTGKSKCHGLVQFVEESGKKAALGLNKVEIDGHTFSVLPSKFPAVAEPVVKIESKAADIGKVNQFRPRNLTLKK
jgi:RNA recognition motif-containing protein